MKKQSFRHKKTEKEKDEKMGQEFGTAIKNDPKNYPKTGEWGDEKPVISDKCIGCGVCVANCPEGMISLGNDSKAKVDYSHCKGCGICAEVCPVKAIEMKKD